MSAFPRARHVFEARCQANTWSRYVGNNTVLCRVLGDYPCYVDTRDSAIAPWLMMTGYWESWVTVALDSLIHQGDRVVDVGANVGYFTLAFAAAVGGSGAVLSIEANPELVALINRSASLHPFGRAIQVRHLAVTDKSGQSVKLSIPEVNIGGASVVANFADSSSAEPRSFDVTTSSLDDLLADWDRVDLVKIDIEGAEQQAWRGMRKTIERNPHIKIAIEFAACRYARADRFLGSFRDAGFRVDAIMADGVGPVPDEMLLDESTDWMLLLHR